MIYLDTSVALAQLLAEDRHPPPDLWEQDLVSSRLLEYEMWTRIHARGLAKSHGDAVRTLLSRVAFLELERPVLEPALEPFASPVRSLDALHLASIDFLRRRDQQVTLATYDDRQAEAARRMKIPLLPMGRRR